MNNRRPTTLLVTGFGPFPGVTINPTARMAEKLGASRRFERLGVRVVAHVFPTRWGVVARDLPELLARVKPDAALHLGVAARRRFIAVETLARPAPSTISPDASGASAPRANSESVRALKIAAPTGALLAAFRRAGAPTRLSNNAGRYLCNALYHQSLTLRDAARETRPTLFIHTPQEGGRRSTIPTRRLRTKKPSPQATMRGLENAMALLARLARMN